MWSIRPPTLLRKDGAPADRLDAGATRIGGRRPSIEQCRSTRLTKVGVSATRLYNPNRKANRTP